MVPVHVQVFDLGIDELGLILVVSDLQKSWLQLTFTFACNWREVLHAGDIMEVIRVAIYFLLIVTYKLVLSFLCVGWRGHLLFEIFDCFQEYIFQFDLLLSCFAKLFQLSIVERTQLLIVDLPR